jgi:hypothetical protein
MKSVQYSLVLTAAVLLLGASSQCYAGTTTHETSTTGLDTRMGRTTGNDSITDGTLERQGEVTIHESDERHPASVSADRASKH